MDEATARHLGGLTSLPARAAGGPGERGSMPPEASRRVRQPWFRRHPPLAVAIAVALFGGVLALRFLVNDPGQPLTLFVALPIALLAVTSGRRGGLAGGVLAGLLLVSWTVLDDVTLPVLSWLARLLPLLLLGGLLGDATDRLRRAESQRIRLETAAQRSRDAIEVNDNIVQGLIAARWSLEAGDSARGLQIVTDMSAWAQLLVSDMLRDGDQLPAVRPPA